MIWLGATIKEKDIRLINFRFVENIELTTLYRPVGPEELALIEESG